ncbi:hypothetical protein HK099_007501 [Clydaea vesicula]|uniref:Uncharacterized protein n=1 Tax=Clydaea vesicula TaxID=447962 RepID=A0AAD5TX23_9FUNG|nr:hypothetical protein HK099_007501 [Clydaea vesicula]
MSKLEFTLNIPPPKSVPPLQCYQISTIKDISDDYNVMDLENYFTNKQNNGIIVFSENSSITPPKRYSSRPPLKRYSSRPPPQISNKPIAIQPPNMNVLGLDKVNKLIDPKKGDMK